MILLYHSVVSNNNSCTKWNAGQALPKYVFEKHLKFLVSNYEIVPLQEYINNLGNKKTKRKRIAITFDDGLFETFHCVFPVFTNLQIPFTIFVSTNHIETDELLWFNYLKALCFDNQYDQIIVDEKLILLETLEQKKIAWDYLRAIAKRELNPKTFTDKLIEKYPLNKEVSDFYKGMDSGQLLNATKSNLCDIGAHTHTHPYLNLMSKEDQKFEIRYCKDVLKEITGVSPRYFAYPGGEYNLNTIEIVKKSGFEAAFAVIPKNLDGKNNYEIGRIGIYSQSLLKLKLKTFGLAKIARAVNFPIG